MVADGGRNTQHPALHTAHHTAPDETSPTFWRQNLLIFLHEAAGHELHSQGRLADAATAEHDHFVLAHGDDGTRSVIKLHQPNGGRPADYRLSLRWRTRRRLRAHGSAHGRRREEKWFTLIRSGVFYLLLVFSSYGETLYTLHCCTSS